MSDISTEITRLKDAKSNLISICNSLASKSVSTTNPPTIDNILKLLQTIIGTPANARMEAGISSTYILDMYKKTGKAQQRPLVYIYSPSQAVGEAITGTTVSEFHAAMFCAGTQKLSTTLGAYNLAEATANDIFFIDPNGTVTKWNAERFASNIIRLTIRSHIEELPCIKARS